MNLIKKLFPRLFKKPFIQPEKSTMQPKVAIRPKRARERLKVLHFIKTNAAEYFVYNTQTLQGIDCVNIEIERVDEFGDKELLLEHEIFEESMGAMCGVAFSSLVIDAVGRLKELIKGTGEMVIEDKKV